MQFSRIAGVRGVSRNRLRQQRRGESYARLHPRQKCGGFPPRLARRARSDRDKRGKCNDERSAQHSEDAAENAVFKGQPRGGKQSPQCCCGERRCDQRRDDDQHSDQRSTHGRWQIKW